ncbi:MAG: DUF357 domain-containing protein [Candidatus Nanoarchaeia archaeon]|nr:DUF357 domain-containing protein [Candidatus Haiyanarchaeum thermophilum]MCW1306919.1 DUF357 domain-containing protein [Candidatus Haiyanarchaeum thermophilum]MCW1308344.1 DUF357 domain-containing protein [Candidatus Haiyanarchaeum thermophilum]MCW1309054.1 DUF357 domain-containing protein [Candidatus Haiyanarchaeum thermophilum]
MFKLSRLVANELSKLEQVMNGMKVMEGGKEVMELARSYLEDSKYFFKRREYLKAFELVNYIWGLLDACAILKLVDPMEFRKYFKVD